jgi:hypothetical protein
MQVEDDNISAVTICIENHHKDEFTENNNTETNIIENNNTDDYIQRISHNINNNEIKDKICDNLKFYLIMSFITIVIIFVLGVIPFIVR